MVALLTSEQSQLETGPLEDVLEVGSLVYVTCYGPYWGVKGIIRAVDVLAHTDTSSRFYLVDLQEGGKKEPVWFVYDDVATFKGENVSRRYPEQSRLATEALSIMVNVLGQELDRSLETLATV